MANSVMLITGASSGIGAALARRAAVDHRLVLLSRTLVPSRVVASLGGADRVLALSCDVRDWNQLHDACEHAVDRFGAIDVAVANAGVAQSGSFLTGPLDPDGWKEMVLTNVYGTALSVRAVVPALLKSQGHLILVGSVAGTVVVPGDLYAATKWAVTGLGRALRAELSAQGVRVTLLQPGLTDAGERGPGRTHDPALNPDDVATAAMFALAQPHHVDIGELVVRPLGQAPHR